MKLDEKHNIEEQIQQMEEIETAVGERWKWVRRFVLTTIVITLFMQSCYFFATDDDDIYTLSSLSGEKSHTVLHTGFPPTEKISGLSIQFGKAAATAFSPNPSSSSSSSVTTTTTTTTRDEGESWWDRLFPNRHVHLVSVQIPVVDKNHSSNQVNDAVLSICGSKRQKFGLSPQVPDLSKCVSTVAMQTEDVDEQDLFGVLEWVPDVTVVLKKSKLYWLVVQTTAESFEWVYAEGGMNQYGTAYETEVGWEFKLEGDSIPSAMVTVENHAKN